MFPVWTLINKKKGFKTSFVRYKTFYKSIALSRTQKVSLLVFISFLYYLYLCKLWACLAFSSHQSRRYDSPRGSTDVSPVLTLQAIKWKKRKWRVAVFLGFFFYPGRFWAPFLSSCCRTVKQDSGCFHKPLLQQQLSESSEWFSGAVATGFPLKCISLFILNTFWLELNTCRRAQAWHERDLTFSLKETNTSTFPVAVIYTKRTEMLVFLYIYVFIL